MGAPRSICVAHSASKRRNGRTNGVAHQTEAEINKALPEAEFKLTLILRKPGDLDHGIVLVLERSSPTGGAGWFPSNLSCPQTSIMYPPIERTRMCNLQELWLSRDRCARDSAPPLDCLPPGSPCVA